MAEPELPHWFEVLRDEHAKAAPGENRIPPLYRVPSHLARCLNQICIRMTADVLAPYGMVPPQYGILGAIDTEPGIDQRRLAERLSVDRTNTGKFLDHLEAMGLVERRVDPADRRARLLWLTKRGREMRRRLRPAMLAAQDRVLAPLAPDEKVTLIRLLARVVEANEEHARPGAGRRPRRSQPPPSPKREFGRQQAPSEIGVARRRHLRPQRQPSG